MISENTDGFASRRGPGASGGPASSSARARAACRCCATPSPRADDALIERDSPPSACRARHAPPSALMRRWLGGRSLAARMTTVAALMSSIEAGIRGASGVERRHDRRRPSAPAGAPANFPPARRLSARESPLPAPDTSPDRLSLHTGSAPRDLASPIRRALCCRPRAAALARRCRLTARHPCAAPFRGRVLCQRLARGAARRGAAARPARASSACAREVLLVADSRRWCSRALAAAPQPCGAWNRFRHRPPARRGAVLRPGDRAPAARVQAFWTGAMRGIIAQPRRARPPVPAPAAGCAVGAASRSSCRGALMVSEAFLRDPELRK